METEEGDIRRIGPLFQRERFASGLRVAERFQALGEKYGKSPAQVAIAWVLAQPGVVCALTGPSTIPHLEENLGGAGAVRCFCTADDARGPGRVAPDAGGEPRRRIGAAAPGLELGQRNPPGISNEEA